MKFLRNVLATIVGLFLFCIISLFGILIVGAIFGSASDGKSTTVKDNSVIELNLEEITRDYEGKTIITDFPLFSDDTKTGLVDIINAIDNAKTDDKIKGITIVNNTSYLGLAQIKALRDKLEDFKTSGKFIVSYANYFTQGEYYLNSVADTIYVNPVGELDFKGLSSEVLYFKGLQEKTGVHMEVIRHGKYKSAVEPFLEDKMSEQNREQISELLVSVWDNLLNDISKSRKISVERLNQIANNLEARTPKLALENKLIDKIGYEDEFVNGIKKALNIKAEDDYNTVSISDYATNVKFSSKDKATNKIAVIYAQGSITSGEGSVDEIAEGYFRRSLKEALKDKNVKAIVLRVDSPGGSALTSELIWREIELAKKRKPIVVSMGNYAASGGYYISCNADKIFAEPNTITGSIGVFGMLPNASKLANNYGVNAELVTTNENSADYSLFRPMDSKVKETITESIENIYDVFVNRVATGRKMTYEQVDAIAQGRVWTGIQAKKIGLVDEIGGLNDAIVAAAKIAKIKDYKTANYPEFELEFKDFMSKLYSSPFMQSKEDFIKEEIGQENYELLEKLRKLNKAKGVQAALPFELNIK